MTVGILALQGREDVNHPGTVGRRGRTAQPVVAAMAVGPFRGSGPGAFEAQIDTNRLLTFTCGATWGRTVLQMDGVVVIDVTGAQMVSHIVRPTGAPIRFDVHTDGTWTAHLEQVSQVVPSFFRPLGAEPA